MAERIASEGVAPDLVLCSSARRARETLTLVSVGLRPLPEVRVEDELYAADAAVLLDRLGRVRDEVGSVMLVGHNPGLQELGTLLLDRPGRTRMAQKFPTAALATLSARVPTWRGLQPGSARLRGLVRPRDG